MKARALAMTSFVGLALLAGKAANAQDQELRVEQHANVQMMIESILHGVHMQTDGSPVAADGALLQLSGQFDAEQFTATGVGSAGPSSFSIDYQGTLAPASDGMLSSVDGQGSLGDEFWQSSITGIWGMNADRELVSLDYREVADDGAGLKPKWWVYAAEIIAGGALGSVGGVGAGTVAGAAAAVNISNAIDSKVADPGAAPPPPGGDVLIEMEPAIAADQIVVVVAGTGEAAGNRANRVRFRGTWTSDPATGRGQVFGEIVVDASAACYADLDGDGQLTVFDFLAFQNAFSSGDAIADCDGDGALSLFDFLCFQNAFSRGC